MPLPPFGTSVAAVATIRCADTELGYAVTGEGPPVVLVHAGIADRRMWEPLVPALARRHRVIRYDWRGYGESGLPPGPFAHHADLLALLDALEVERAALVGCSMGGSYALEAALAAPHRVTALGLVCSGLSGHAWPEPMLRQAAERVHSVVPAERRAAYQAGGTTPWLHRDAAATAEAHVEWMVAGPDRSRADLRPDVWELATRMFREYLERSWAGDRPEAPERLPEPRPRERLAEIGVPALVLNGTADVPEIQQVSGILANGIPGARRVDLPGTGHLPPLERPAEVARELLTLLERPARW